MSLVQYSELAVNNKSLATIASNSLSDSATCMPFKAMSISCGGPGPESAYAFVRTTAHSHADSLNTYYLPCAPLHHENDDNLDSRQYCNVMSR